MTPADNRLSVTEFIAEQGFDIDQLYVDKFWDNISDDKWIYVGNEMLEWIGYSAGDMRKLKQHYVQLLENNFSQGNDYKQLTASEMKKSYVQVDLHIGSDASEIKKSFVP
jgi:hypothetical protein